jgi:hypothetical protein
MTIQIMSTIVKTAAALLTIVISILRFVAPYDSATDRLDLGDTLVFARPSDGGRSYVRTSRTDFARRSFQAEVTVTLKGGGGAGCAFFGMGRGQGNPDAFQEPSTAPSVFMRLAPSDFAGGMVTVSVNGRESQCGTLAVGDGTHRLRLTWDSAGKRALFEVDANWNGKTTRTGSSVAVNGADINFGSDARLFVGGASGVKFARFTSKPLTVAEINAADFGESFPNDPTAGTWLAQAKGAQFIPALRAGRKLTIDSMLKALSGELRLLACWYDGSKLAASRPFVAGELRTPNTRWTSKLRVTPVASEPDAVDLAITFKLAEGKARSAGVAVALDLSDWSTNNYVLIPASVYNGNRNRIEYRGYCTGFDAGDFYKKGMPVTHGDVPRLELEPGKPSKIEVNACNAATPAICVFNRHAKRALIVLAEQGIREDGQIVDNGLMIEESIDRRRATLVVSAPGVRQRKPEFIGFSPSPDRGIDWKAGKEITLRLRVYLFKTPDIPGLLDKFMTVRKAVTGPNHPRNLIPFSHVTRLMTGRIDSRWHQSAAVQYYGDSNCDDLCLGWVGGLIDTFPMLALGDKLHRQRVARTFDFVIPVAAGKSGYFLAAVHADGKASGRDWYPNQPIVLTRQNADVLFWMTKQFMLLKAQGHTETIKPAWEQAAKRLAQALVNTWKRHGQWGNYVNHETGDIAVYNSTSGATAIGGLALAAEWFHNPEFLSVAREAAEYYYSTDYVQKGFTYGACSDIMQNADSETAAGFMTALMALYEATGESRWLEMSRNLANLAATWTVSYDYELPKNTELGSLGAKLAGVYWASTQNKHGAPGICTSSGDALLKIYRATGDQRYAELLRDIAHAHAEGIKPDGRITERLTYCDADSRGSRGSAGDSTGWNELNGILMAMELPGIYVRTDKDEIFVFDHVEAQSIKRDNEGVTLKIANPTRFDAQVTILAENAAQAQRPLGPTGFLKWPKVEIKSGKATQITVRTSSTHPL